MADQANNQTQQELSEILQIRRNKLKALQEAGRNPFEITTYDVTHHTQDIKDHFDELEGTVVSVGGRLMSKRGMGKVSFCVQPLLIRIEENIGNFENYSSRMVLL